MCVVGLYRGIKDMTQNTMSNIVAIFSPRREYYSFYSFFIFSSLLITQRPLCFMWKPRIDTTKILYFFWSNIVWSKNKKRTTYVIRNIHLNLSFFFFMFRRDRMKQQRYDFLILRPLVYLFSVVSSPETKIEDVIG